MLRRTKKPDPQEGLLVKGVYRNLESVLEWKTADRMLRGTKNPGLQKGLLENVYVGL